MISQQWLHVHQYLKILENPYYEKCTNVPPVLPAPGELYVYNNKDKTEDWKADMYRWRLKGRKFIPRSNPSMICTYYHTYKGSGFQKRVYLLITTEHHTVLIHYYGSLTNVIRSSHGNRKENKDIPFIRTAPSQLEKQKTLLKSQPNEICKKLSTEDENPALIPVMLPRNPKQVCNTISNERNRRLLSDDDITGLYLINQELDGYVVKMKLLPDFIVILISKEMSHKFTSFSREMCTLYYDTTFNLGDFYVSPLTYQTCVLQNNVIIPLAYLIHHTKKKETHKSFFKFLRYYCPSIIGKPIVTDREKAIQ